jgi:hypothetical protein
VIERWYKETIKVAKTGDHIKIITDLYEDEGIEAGDIYEVKEQKQDDLLIELPNNTSQFLHKSEFVVLEKTNMIRVGPKEYKEITAVRNEGDLILPLRENEKKGFKKGQVLRVKKIEGEMLSAEAETGEHFTIWFGEYIAIQPLTNEGSVERRVLDRFSEAEKALLASPISTVKAFELVVAYLKAVEEGKKL